MTPVTNRMASAERDHGEVHEQLPAGMVFLLPDFFPDGLDQGPRKAKCFKAQHDAQVEQERPAAEDASQLPFHKSDFKPEMFRHPGGRGRLKKKHHDQDKYIFEPSGVAIVNRVHGVMQQLTRQRVQQDQHEG